MLTLKANPYWWGRAAGMTPKLTAVDYKIFVGTDTEYAAYAHDKTYDVDEDIPPLQLASVRQQRDFHRGPYLGYEGVAMNFKIPPFDNVDARAAFCLALNKDQLNDTLFKGANIPTWHLVPEGMPGYNPNLQPLDGAPTTGNQVLARREWQKYLTTLHGAPAPPIQFTYFPGSPTLTAFANTMITSWKQVLGVTVALDPLYPHLKDEAAKPRQLSRWARSVGYPDPQDFLSVIYATSSSYNWNNSGSPAIDRLMNQADHSMDNSARFPLYNQAEQMLVDDVSDCPLVQLALNYRVRVSVHGYVLDPEGDVATPDWPRVAITA